MVEKLAVITVAYENYSILKDFFASLNSQTDPLFSVFIADLSRNKNPVILPSFASIQEGPNKGYAYGVNMGVKKALGEGYEFFCVVNSDTVLTPDFIENVKASLNKNKSSIIGGKIYYAKGYEYHKGTYKNEELGHVLWYAGGTVDWNHALTPHRGVDVVDAGQYDTFGKTGFVNGCLMGFDRSVVERVGLWDESYFLYFEDADYCERAKRRGIALYYDPAIVIYHKNAQSTGGSGSKMHRSYQRKSRLKFGLKYAPLKTKLHLLSNFIRDQITGTNK